MTEPSAEHPDAEHVAWRLTKAKYAESALAGSGALLHGQLLHSEMRHSGRWHRRGQPVVYAADSPALALLETMVQIEDASLLDIAYVVIPIRFSGAYLMALERQDLPGDWNAWPWPASTQNMGARWLEEAPCPVLRIPSATVPHQSNYLINPSHPDFGHLQVGPAEPFPIDLRLHTRT